MGSYRHDIAARLVCRPSIVGKQEKGGLCGECAVTDEGDEEWEKFGVGVWGQGARRAPVKLDRRGQQQVLHGALAVFAALEQDADPVGIHFLDFRK